MFKIRNLLNYHKLGINLRKYVQKVVENETVNYTKTINLPKTKFPLRLSAKKRCEVEEKLLTVNIKLRFHLNNTRLIVLS